MQEIIEIENFLNGYLIEFDRTLFKIESYITDKNTMKIIKSGWVTISKSSAFYLICYRKNFNKGDIIYPATYYMLSFLCRLLLETSSDVCYLLENPNEIPKFLKEYEKFKYDSDESLLNELMNKDYYRQFILNKKTTVRIENCYGERGVVDYNLLCLNSHFNYLGYLLTKNEIGTMGVRIGNLRFILDALNKFLDSIENVCDSNLLRILIGKRKESENIMLKIIHSSENWRDLK